MNVGIIGESTGNGHPISWSAICNGYRSSELKRCGYQNIYNYIKKQIYPNDFIDEIKITSIWTENEDRSKQIADAVNINKVYINLEEMAKGVDALIIARDDYEQHEQWLKVLAPFKKPILIDKPFSVNSEDAIKLLKLEEYEGQFFSCSSNRYDERIIQMKTTMGKRNINRISGTCPKQWDKYAIHLIEPIAYLFDYEMEVMHAETVKKGASTMLLLILKGGLKIELECTGKQLGEMSLTFHEMDQKTKIDFTNPFQIFKSMLTDFYLITKSKRESASKKEILKIVQLIEMGI